MMQDSDVEQKEMVRNASARVNNDRASRVGLLLIMKCNVIS